MTRWLRVPLPPIRTAAQYTRRQLPGLGRHALERSLQPMHALTQQLLPPHREPPPPSQALAARRPEWRGKRLSKIMVGARVRAREGRVILHDVAEELKAKGSGSLLSRFKRVVADYGRVALLFHATNATLTFGAFYAGLTLGDADFLMRQLPPGVTDNISPELGNIALAFILCECTALPRYAATIVVAPLIAEKIRYTRTGALLGLKAIRRKGLPMAFLPGRHPRLTLPVRSLSKALF